MYLDSRRYLAENSGKKTTHSKLSRIVMQAITGVNESVRLKMTLIEPGVFCANSVNYIVFEDRDINLAYALGIMNSKLLNFIFTKSSTNSNVNGYEIDNLPFVKATEAQQSEIAALVNEILTAKKKMPGVNLIESEAKIDWLTYHLYGLTKAEIEIIEEEANNEPFPLEVMEED